MSYRTLAFTFGTGVLALGLPLAGCGDYSADPPPSSNAGTNATAGTTTTGGGGAGTAGSTSTAGSGGSAAGTSTTGGGGTGGREPPPEPSCQNVTACGGDVLGVWFATGSCLPVTGMANLGEFGIGCTMAPAKGKLEVTGNWTLGADGKISDNTTTTGDMEIELSKECLDISGTVSTCDRVSAPLSSIGFELTCVNSTVTAGGCTCTGKVNQNGGMARVSYNAAATGTYKTEDNKVVVTGGDNPEYAYCIQGNFMTVSVTSVNNIGKVDGTVVFQKQP